MSIKFEDVPYVDSFHDTVLEALGESYDNVTLKAIYELLPDDIKYGFALWTFGDTVYRDEAYCYITDNVETFRKIVA